MEDWKAQYEKVLGRSGISGFNVAEAELRLAAREASPDTPRAPRYIVGVRFYRGSEIYGKTYSYFCDHKVHVGDHAVVQAPDSFQVVKVVMTHEMMAHEVKELIARSAATKFIICVITEPDIKRVIGRAEGMAAARNGNVDLATTSGSIVHTSKRKSRKGAHQVRESAKFLSNEELYNTDIPF